MGYQRTHNNSTSTMSFALQTALPMRTTATFSSKVKSQTRSNTRGAKVQTKAFSDVNVTISAANALMLSLGRFASMPYQRAQMGDEGRAQRRNVLTSRMVAMT